jgi:hypothetical protein
MCHASSPIDPGSSASHVASPVGTSRVMVRHDPDIATLAIHGGYPIEGDGTGSRGVP